MLHTKAPLRTRIDKSGIRYLFYDQLQFPVCMCNSLVDFVIVFLFYVWFVQQLKLVGLNNKKEDAYLHVQ